MIVTILVFIIILGTLVLVHELGHFLVAKRNGVPSEEFGFGFPPRIVGTYKDKEGQRRWIFGNKEIEQEVKEREETVYSLNLIPIGGFVKIKGEDGEHKDDPKSFASQKVWTRFKVLFAGVAMNFVLAVVLFFFAFMLGLPEAVDDEASVVDGKVQVARIVQSAPADEAGMKMGDQIVSIFEGDDEIEIAKIGQLQEVVGRNKGKTLDVKVIHAGEQEAVMLKIVPRSEFPDNEGPLGVEIVRTAFVKHGIVDSAILAVQTTWSIIVAIMAFLGDLIIKIFTSEPVPADVAGPVGIAVMTGQVTKMGLAFILQFAALLSVNLAIINLLPFPALDGGRILFLGIEKLKGSPVSEKVEGIAHTIGFFILIGLMILVTVRDFANFEIFSKMKGIF